MNEAEARAAIVAEALSWERTPYHGHARLKGVGVDCAQLPLGVYGPQGVGLVPDIRPQYSQQWMMSRDEEQYVAQIMQYAREIPMERIQPGDLVIWKFGRTFSHSAIVVDPPIVIHATVAAEAVVRCDIEAEEDYKTRPRRAFSIFEPGGSLVYKGDE